MRKGILTLLLVVCVFLSFSSFNFRETINSVNTDSNNGIMYADSNLNSNTYVNTNSNPHNTEDCFYNPQNIFKDEFYSTHYFYNLKNNFGNNIKGSCGYVSIAMMLSFYDTYLDDTIIAEQYDEESVNLEIPILSQVDSPGILFESNSFFESGITNASYYNKVELLSSEYFHMYLIRMGEEQFNLYRPNETFPGNLFVEESEYPCGLYNDEMVDLLEYYLYTVAGRDTNEVYIEQVNIDIRNYVISKIRQGQPVIISVSGLFDGSHACVAYDYDEINDEIYAHWGWAPYENLEYNHIALSTADANILTSAITINFVETVEHIHSNNYEYVKDLSSSTNVTYCSCYFPCHPEHECSYEYYDEEQHVYSCGCVANETDETDENEKFDHDFVYLNVPNDLNAHIVKCSTCEYMYIEEHDFEATYVDADTHSGVCRDCGHEAILEHSWEYTSNITGGHTKTCSDCGYSESEAHVYGYTSINADTHKGTCSLCGDESIEDHYFNCTYVDADTHSGVCRECGYEAVLEHSYEYKAIDSTYHILTCKCGATSGTSSKHLWTATSNENVVKCKTCARTKILAPGEMIPIIKTKPIIIEEETE